MLVSRLFVTAAWFVSFAASEPWPAIRHAHGKGPNTDYFFKGHDVSSLKMLEDGVTKAEFKDKHGVVRPVEYILKDGGANAARLRLFVESKEEPYNLHYTLELAARLRKAGLSIYLDLHLSNSWADPSRNMAPEGWPTNMPELEDTVRRYVKFTLRAFHTAGIQLTFISLGNEVRNGILWPIGRADLSIKLKSERVANMMNFAKLYKAARHGVDDYAYSVHNYHRPAVVLHMDNGWDLPMQQLWFDTFLSTRVVTTKDFDVIGFSCYPTLSKSATIHNLAATLEWGARRFPDKKIHVVETNWPAKCDGPHRSQMSEHGIPISPAGQKEWMMRVQKVLKDLPNNVGGGLWNWDSTWLNNTALGTSCQDVVLFDHDWSRPPHVTGLWRESVEFF